ncbi:hypothetical protein HDV57DRAFT_462956 [Trichoderma longibrachiatum]
MAVTEHVISPVTIVIAASLPLISILSFAPPKKSRARPDIRGVCVALDWSCQVIEAWSSINSSFLHSRHCDEPVGRSGAVTGLPWSCCLWSGTTASALLSRAHPPDRLVFCVSPAEARGHQFCCRNGTSSLPWSMRDSHSRGHSKALMLPGAVDAAGHDISQTVDFGHSKTSGRETVGRSYIYIQSPAAAGVLQRWNLQAGIRLRCIPWTADDSD